MENTSIEWADHTFNPWVGCTKVSPGCDNCYAEVWARRSGSPQLWQGKRRLTQPANWSQPLKWNAEAQETGKRPRVFCASLADVFDNDVPQLWRTRLFALIYDTPHLDWLLLTKRIGNAARMLAEDPPEGIRMAELPNLWLGVTVVNQQEADRDIPKLLATPARVRFLSCEPLLSRLDITPFIWGRQQPCPGCPMDVDCDCGFMPTVQIKDAPAINWVIAGGESGAKARPSVPDWFRSLREQCAAAAVPFLFKQWGEYAPAINFPHELRRFGKALAGRTLDGRIHDEYPVIQ